MTNQPKIEWIDFGFETVPVNEKQSRVADVFSSVSSSYDIMNDLMSGGVHRLWKDALMDWLAPCKGQVLIDLAGGTGDIALRFLKRGGSHVHVVDINPDMISAGKKRRDIKAYSNQLDWTIASAEDIPLQTGTAERVTISFGLRNVTNRDMALREAFRVLKPGGRFCCLEFSTVQNATFSKLYDLWSFNALPQLGRMVARDEAAYRYLAESIRTFPAQHDLARMMSEAGFAQVRFRNLSNGIAAIHSGWKLD
ncbi:MAG: class I SAM-dependent methyltransferase [Candidatus Puniceispirillaceae bacterium]